MLVVWRRGELPLDRETVDGIIRMLMAINAKVDRLLGEEEREFEAMYERLKARWREEDERRERRRRRIRRLLPFRRAA
jgi:hypothetical protein